MGKGEDGGPEPPPAFPTTKPSPTVVLDFGRHAPRAPPRPPVRKGPWNTVVATSAASPVGSAARSKGRSEMMVSPPAGGMTVVQLTQTVPSLVSPTSDRKRSPGVLGLAACSTPSGPPARPTPPIRTPKVQGPPPPPPS